MSDTQVFAIAVASANRWIDELTQFLALPPDSERRTLHALRAGLHAVRDRLPTSEVVDLGAQLPLLIRGLYYEGWTGRHDPTRIRNLEDLIAHVAERLGPVHRVSPIDALRGVITLLVEHVSPGEIRDVIATFPEPIATLWGEIANQVGP